MSRRYRDADIRETGRVEAFSVITDSDRRSTWS